MGITKYIKVFMLAFVFAACNGGTGGNPIPNLVSPDLGTGTTTITSSIPGPFVANGTSVPITIIMLDGNSDPLIGVIPTFSATDTDSTNSYLPCTPSDINGISYCVMSSLRAEVKTLQLISPQNVVGDPIQFIADTPTDIVLASASLGPAQTAGVNFDVQPVVRLEDANSNIVEWSTDTIQASVHDNAACSSLAPGILYADTNPITLDGITGIATFSNMFYDNASAGRYLKIESPSLPALTPLCLGPFSTAVGSPVAANSNIIGSSPVIANGVATSNITITIRDIGNTPLAGYTPTFDATDTGATNVYSACSVTDGLGNSTCTMTSTFAEVKTLSIQTPVVRADGNVTFDPGPADIPNSSIIGTGPVIANGVATSTVTITLQDAFSNPIPGVVPTFNATDTGTDNIYGACSLTNASGVSTCTLTSTTTETKTLSIQTPIIDAGGTVDFVPDVADPANSDIQGTGPIVADGVANSTITITLRDSTNNPVPGETPTFSATDTGTDNTYGACSVSDASGISTCTLASTTAEVKTLTITAPASVNGDIGGTVQFNPGPADIATSDIQGTGPVIADGVATSTVTITLQDAFSNPIPGVVPTFSATDTGTDNIYGVCSLTNASGVSTCTLASATVETKTLSIQTPIIDAGGTVDFVPGLADPANSDIQGTGPIVADGVANSTITITLRDSTNNPVPGETPTFSATDTGTDNTYGACSVSDASGISTCTLASTTAEVKTLTITAPASVNGDIGGTVQFDPGPADTATSTITGTGPVIADGVATSTVTITLQDAFSNPIPGVVPTFSATDTGTDNTYGACSVSDASGVSTCTLASATVETKTLSIQTPIIDAGGTVDFVPGLADPANSDIQGTGPVIADGVATSTITITLLDASSNPVPGETPTFSATDTGTDNTYGACSVSDASGISTCTLASTTAEVKTLTITAPASVNGDIGGTVQFDPGPLAVLTYITQPSPTANASVDLATMPVIQLEDANGNVRLTDTSAVNIEAHTNATCSSAASGILNATANPVNSDGVTGQANFAGVNYDTAETIYLRAYNGAIEVCSNAIVVNPNPTKVAFTTEPVDTTDGETMINIVVEIQDATNTVVNVTDTVNLALNSSTAAAGGVLSVPAVAGVATFNAVVITGAEAGLTFTASSGVLTTTNSATFNSVAIPTVGFTGTPPDVNSTNESNYGFSGTCSENGENVNITLGTAGFTATCTGGSFTLTGADVSSEADSPTFNVQLSHSNTVPAPGTATDSTTISKDTAVPTVAIDSPGDVTNANKFNYVFTGTCSENGRPINGTFGQIPSNQRTFSVTCTSLTWASPPQNMTFLADPSTNNIQVLTEDAGGNPSAPASDTFDVNLAAPVPTFTLTTPTEPYGGVGVNTATYTVSSIVSGDTVVLYNQAGCSAGVEDTQVSGGSSVVVSADVTTEQTYLFYFDVNGGTCYGPYTFTKDVTAPAAPSNFAMTSPSNGDTSNDATPEFSGDADVAEENGIVRVYNDISCGAGFEIGNGVIAAGSWNVLGTMPLDGSANGLNNFYAILEDQAGNQSGCTDMSLSYTLGATGLASLQKVAMVAGPTAVVALEDGIDIIHEGSNLGTFNRGQIATFTAARGDVLDCTGACYPVTNRQGTATWASLAYAGRKFSTYIARYGENDPRITVVALETGNTSVQIVQNGTIKANATIAAGGVYVFDNDVDDNPTNGHVSDYSTSITNNQSFQVISDKNINVYFVTKSTGNSTTPGTDDTNYQRDARILMPAATEIIGYGGQITALENGTIANAYRQEGTNYLGINLNNSNFSTTVRSLRNQAQYAMVMTANKPIANTQTADQNGINATPHLPTSMMATVYGIPYQGDYVAFASKQSGTITVYNQVGGIVTTLNLTRNGGAHAQAAYAAWYGTGNVPAGYTFTCSVPCYAIFDSETAPSDLDETLMMGYTP